MPEREYQRLTRSKARSAFGIVSISRSSLWLGRDHLLAIESSGYTENYKRFYFRDIQALVVRKTDVARIVALVAGAVGLLFGLVALFGGLLGGEPVVAWVFGILGGICLVSAGLDLAAGPSCTCDLRTAVQTERLPSVNRLRRARKVIARLRPLVERAQGQIPPEEIPSRLQEFQSTRG